MTAVIFLLLTLTQVTNPKVQMCGHKQGKVHVPTKMTYEYVYYWVFTSSIKVFPDINITTDNYWPWLKIKR